MLIVICVQKLIETHIFCIERLRLHLVIWQNTYNVPNAD